MNHMRFSLLGNGSLTFCMSQTSADPLSWTDWLQTPASLMPRGTPHEILLRAVPFAGDNSLFLNALCYSPAQLKLLFKNPSTIFDKATLSPFGDRQFMLWIKFAFWPQQSSGGIILSLSLTITHKHTYTHRGLGREKKKQGEIEKHSQSQNWGKVSLQYSRIL